MDEAFGFLTKRGNNNGGLNRAVLLQSNGKNITRKYAVDILGMIGKFKIIHFIPAGV
jgi:hypothetical protein